MIALDQGYVLAMGAIILGLIMIQLVRRKLDPFAPHWMFLTGWFQLYVIQAWMYRDYGLRVRGEEVVLEANQRAFLFLVWFLIVYGSGLGRVLARRLPQAPTRWPAGTVVAICIPLVLWGFYCSIKVMQLSSSESLMMMSPEMVLLIQFPILMLVAGILLIVTGRQPDRPNAILTWTGLALAIIYVLIWMFNGKRSHSLFGVLTAVSAFYLPRFKRPPLPIMCVTAVLGAMAVTLAIGWRHNPNYERSASGFFTYMSEFDPEAILVNLNLRDAEENALFRAPEKASKETEEYGGYLLMLDTVPEKAGYDYGEVYLRIVSTYIPRLIWEDKPFYGREAWVNAWIAGSEFKRTEKFTGPSIGLLGACQLNGGLLGTWIVITTIGLFLRTAYEYFRMYADRPWAQAWWAVSYYTAWLMVVNDNPLVWYYYLYGHTTLPPIGFLWLILRGRR